jgi:D-sedoheptulose 7-phosphate isomerase
VRLAAGVIEQRRQVKVLPRRALAEQLLTDADRIPPACLAMARCFAAGGRLLVVGIGAAAADAAHVAVEFLHPVIVGKRALPALSLAGDPGSAGGPDQRYAHQLALTARPGDIALVLATDADDPSAVATLAAARAGGLLTVGLFGTATGVPEVDHLLLAGTADPRLVKEAQVTYYHLLWEIVHVLLDHLPNRSPEAVR